MTSTGMTQSDAVLAARKKEEFTQIDAILSLAVAIDEHGERMAPTKGPAGDRWITIVDQSGEPQAVIEVASICALVKGDDATEIHIRGRENPLMAPRALFGDLRRLIHV